jgi:DNA modification methylase
MTDPPYSARTQAGYRSGSAPNQQVGISYGIIDEAYCRAFVRAWLPRVRTWFVIFGDDVTCGYWRDALERCDLYVFQPVIWVKQAAAPRFYGDGPSSQCEHIAIARRRIVVPRRFRPGHYTAPVVRGASIIGQKPLELMRSLVRDYSEPGEVIIDPHAGTGTTLLAARLEGRRALGAEQDKTTHRLARERLRVASKSAAA